MTVLVKRIRVEGGIQKPVQEKTKKLKYTVHTVRVNFAKTTTQWCRQTYAHETI